MADVEDGNDELLVLVVAIAADGRFDDEELAIYRRHHAVQVSRIGIVRVIWKWMSRIFRTGFSPRKEKEMASEWEEAEGLLVMALAAD